MSAEANAKAAVGARSDGARRRDAAAAAQSVENAAATLSSAAEGHFLCAAKWAARGLPSVPDES